MGERGDYRVRKVVKMCGFGDASDAIDAGECIISIAKGSEDFLDSLSTRVGSSGRGDRKQGKEVILH